MGSQSKPVIEMIHTERKRREPNGILDILTGNKVLITINELHVLYPSCVEAGLVVDAPVSWTPGWSDGVSWGGMS